MSISLLPCPFCNGTPIIRRHGTALVSSIIQCEDCGCKLVSGETGNDCGMFWNRRHPDLDKIPTILDEDGVTEIIDPEWCPDSPQHARQIINLLRNTLSEERAQHKADIDLLNERLEERTEGLLNTAAKARLAPSAPSFRAGWQARAQNPTATLEKSLQEHMKPLPAPLRKRCRTCLGDGFVEIQNGPYTRTCKNCSGTGCQAETQPTTPPQP